MRNNFKILILVSVVIIAFYNLSVSSVSASTTVDIVVSGGSDASTGTPSDFSAGDIVDLGASDDIRIQSNAVSWTNTGIYDENNYIEFLFSPNIPSNATIENVSFSNEFRRSGALMEAKLEVWNGSSFVDQALTTGTTNVDHTDTVDVSAYINTPSKVNNIKARFLAYRNNNADTKTSHDFIGISVTYSIPNTTFIIRNGDSVFYNGSVSLPAIGTVSVNDANNIAHIVDARSVLVVLKTIDDSSDTFAISDLQYFDSFGAFYLKCILPNNDSDLCDNWQYAVNGLTPSISIDATVLSGGETVGIYFGTSHRLVLNTTAITIVEPLNARAEKYDYENNIWNSLTGVSIGVTLPNPVDQWNPIVVSTHPVDSFGNVNIEIKNVNTYTLGIVEDFYFPSYAVTVSPVPNNSKIERYTPPIFSVENALAYLKNTQEVNGSFGADLYTDWTAIAYGAGDVSDNSRDLLLSYFNSHATISPLLTDNERYVMALLALGQNPYSFNNINYIETITKTFDGMQFGDPAFINDDIFALIPLNSAGYTASDEIIIKDIAFIISKQKVNGSWEENADLTGAAIQALNPFISIADANNAVLNAGLYLQNTQNGDGGWGSVYATSWVMQGENALGQTWAKNGHTGLNYLATAQASDGAIFSSGDTQANRIWATSYAIPAVLGKPWNKILKAVQKPVLASIMEEKINDEKVMEKIKNDKRKKETIIVQNKIVPAPKTETARIIKNAPMQSSLAANVVESENQIFKSFSKILPLIEFLFLGFLLW